LPLSPSLSASCCICSNSPSIDTSIRITRQRQGMDSGQAASQQQQRAAFSGTTRCVQMPPYLMTSRGIPPKMAGHGCDLLARPRKYGLKTLSSYMQAQFKDATSVRMTETAAQTVASKIAKLLHLTPLSYRLFGCGISGLEWLRPTFWGRLQPLICLVTRIGSIRLLFGWRTEMGSDPSHFLFGWMDSNRTCIWSPLH
jgi:hypothetical protein